MLTEYKARVKSVAAQLSHGPLQSNLVISDSYISETLIYRTEPLDSAKFG
jgi:hypothetical protein